METARVPPDSTVTFPALVTGEPPPVRLNSLSVTSTVPVPVWVKAGWMIVCSTAVAGSIRLPSFVNEVAVPSLLMRPPVRIVKLAPGSLTISAPFSKARRVCRELAESPRRRCPA